MHATFNIRHLEDGPVTLKGTVSVQELEIEALDELIHPQQPVAYDLVVERIEDGFLAQGTLESTLDCECVRCLKPHQQSIRLEPWTCHLPLEGEDKVAVINDLVDLTPYIREDIVLAFPQHPLCEPECKGLVHPEQDRATREARQSEAASLAWAELNKLKF